MRRTVTVGVGVAVLIIAGWCENRREQDAWDHRNLDPRRGRMLLVENGSRYKVCDGPTLLYVAEGYSAISISSIPDSPECAR